MRAALRLWASAGHLAPFTPTGLHGILTHPSPRPHLIYLYKTTLGALAALPETSVYRQATEALTKHRLAIVEAQVPEGYKEWKSKIESDIQKHPQWALQDVLNGSKWANDAKVLSEYGSIDERDQEWDMDKIPDARPEGAMQESDAATIDLAKDFGHDITESELLNEVYQPPDEPSLSASQISDIENQIGAGIIEEVIIVAKRELDLVHTMKDNAVWEELVEKPVEGQWTYFERSKA